MKGLLVVFKGTSTNGLYNLVESTIVRSVTSVSDNEVSDELRHVRPGHASKTCLQK